MAAMLKKGKIAPLKAVLEKLTNFLILLFQITETKMATIIKIKPGLNRLKEVLNPKLSGIEICPIKTLAKIKKPTNIRYGIKDFRAENLFSFLSCVISSFCKETLFFGIKNFNFTEMVTNIKPTIEPIIVGNSCPKNLAPK